MDTRSLTYAGPKLRLSVINSYESMMAKYDRMVRNTERLYRWVNILCWVCAVVLGVTVAGYFYDDLETLPIVYLSSATGQITKVYDCDNRLVTNPITQKRLATTKCWRGGAPEYDP